MFQKLKDAIFLTFGATISENIEYIIDFKHLFVFKYLSNNICYMIVRMEMKKSVI